MGYLIYFPLLNRFFFLLRYYFYFYFYFLNFIFTMVRKLCEICKDARAMLKRPKTGERICRSCFYLAFETEIHHTIVSENLFERGRKRNKKKKKVKIDLN